MATPWVEKHRPQTLDDVAHQVDLIATLRQTLRKEQGKNNLQHLLFYGPPGTGKTSTILALARDLYGATLAKKRVLELNASSERGIDVIRNKVKKFAQTAVDVSASSSSALAGDGKAHSSTAPAYKIVILDEADSMTRDAQSALRRTMELYTKTTRFCIICNYVSRIIEPIASRCAKFRFQPLPLEPMIARLRSIADAEHIACAQQALHALVTVSDGDLRKAITLMQSAQRLLPAPSQQPLQPSGADSKSEQQLQPQHVMEVAGLVPDDMIARLLAACKSRKAGEAQRMADEAIAEGFAADQLLVQLQAALLDDAELDDVHKAALCVRIAEADKKLVDGADGYLQLLDVLLASSSVAK